LVFLLFVQNYDVDAAAAAVGGDGGEHSQD